jgi:hypothetical protein
MNQEFEQPENPDMPLPPPPPPQEKRLGFLLMAFLIGAVIPALLCLWLPVRAKMKTQAEAVKAGHAVYKVVDEFGTTRFEWLPPHEGALPEKK